LLLLAGLYTALNAARPVLIDDAAYERFARNIARQPLDPYGFAILWYDHPQPANEVLAPPAFLYYWALVRYVVGERPWLWKLALLPWALLLVASLHGLFRRFGRSRDWGLTACVVFSPGLLPSFNLMLDVPALALALAAIYLFLAAVDRPSPALATCAGLLVGVAMQTKYTALLAPAVMLLYACLRRRPGLALLAGLMAAHLFVLWELLTALLYGRSHFLLALGDGGGLLAKLEVFPSLGSVLGGAFPLAALLALAALGVGRRWLALGGAVLALGYALVALLDVRFTTDVAPAPFLPGGPWKGYFNLAEVLFHSLALAAAVAAGVLAWPLLRREWRSPPRRRSVEATFLVLWLALEGLGYLMMTPFPAVRRVLGALVVLALLIAHGAARTGMAPGRRGALRASIAASIVLGLACFLLDWRCVAVHKSAAEEAARLAHGKGTVWYVGHWGFQYYAERAGMRPVVTATDYRPERAPLPLPPPSRLLAGDWLVVPDARLAQQGLRLDGDKLELGARIGIGDAVPLTTIPGLYGGRTLLQHHSGTRLEVFLFRVTKDFVPAWSDQPLGPGESWPVLPSGQASKAGAAVLLGGEMDESASQ
jgi:hypothetical protein